MRSLAVCLCLGCLAACAGAPAPRPDAFALGERAPLLGEVELLQAPTPRLELDALEGQVVVLELWATWCQPCVEAVPHLNELAARFDGKGVTFVAVTDEPREEILAFLKKTPMRGWIGLHRGELPLARLGLRGLPATALLGRDGQLLGLTHPEHLQAEHIEAALRGERPDLPPPPARVSTRSAPDPSAIAFAIQLDKASPDSSDMSWQPREGGFEARGLDLRALLELAYDLPAARVRVEGDLPGGRWNLSLTLPRAGWDMDALHAELQHALRTGLGLVERRVTEPTQVWVLAVADAARVEKCKVAEKTSGEAMLRPDRLQITSSPVLSLVEMLSKITGQTILDETGLSGDFDFLLPFGMGHGASPSAESLAPVLEERAGLSLKSATRPMESVILTAPPAPHAPGPEGAAR
jgi:uncharacterized protein (TIGR03435 family)